ncbi:MAG: T9SS type A sorting domain-containing protein, partial [Bacteroidetes bacterium]|nr:T9SS type A sorting domain-containing protein [Bacteroidota bacterium]
FTGSPGPATAIEEEPGEQPRTFALAPNYPNPFNPRTTIAFTLAQPSAVTLSVYDLTGRKVAALLSGEKKTTGRHSVSFDARGLASGTYVYRLEATPADGTGKTFSESRRMVLVK